MLFLAIVLCCLTLWCVFFSWSGPEVWHKKMRPGAPEPTESGYRVLYWRNWLVTVLLVAASVVAIDHLWLSEAEFREAARRVVDSQDGAPGVSADRIMGALELELGKDISVRSIETEDDDRTSETERFELIKSDDADDADAAAVCVEITTYGSDSQQRFSSISFSTGRCS
jgi:hypothetical protein